MSSAVSFMHMGAAIFASAIGLGSLQIGAKITNQHKTSGKSRFWKCQQLKEGRSIVSLQKMSITFAYAN